jgi:ubiquinone/menaquinone biosynthesis C-methylase UbiE
MKEKWQTWDNDKDYGQVLYQRAIGELPEMESSKAAAKILKAYMREGYRILDVGCGAGHYLRSYRREIKSDFSYTGLDATKNYIALAKKAFKGQQRVNFTTGDVYKIDYKSNNFDIAVSNNLLQHLPSIQKPIEELCRVAKRMVILRMLVGERSFIIKEICNRGKEFNNSGEPQVFNFFNIYSKDYMHYLLSKIKKVKEFKISEDTQFNPRHIQQSVNENKGAYDVTTVMGKWQVNGYILEPWAFVVIDLHN